MESWIARSGGEQLLKRFCQHTRLAFLARNVPPDVMMRPADAGFDPGRGDWGSGILQRSNTVPVPVLIQSSIVLVILQLGLGATFATLSQHELAWCCVFVELPQGWSGHYASASEIGHGSVLQRDCSPGFLAGLTPACLRMGCWSESCRSHQLEQLCPSNPQTASR